MLEYKGFKIAGSSIPMYRLNGSIVEVARIKGKIFKTMKEAEAHGLDLAKEWVDNQTAVEGS